MMGFKVFFEKFININGLSILTKGSYPGCSSRIRKKIARCLDPNTVFKNLTDCQPETIVGIALHQNEDVNVYYLQGLCYVVEFKNLMSDLLKKAEGLCYYVLAYQTSLVNSQDAQQLQDSSQIIYIGLDDAKDELSLLIKKYGQMVRLNYLDNVNDLIKQVMLAKFDTGNEVNQEVSLYIINSTKEIVMSEGSIKSIDELGITFIFINSHFNSLC
ncbi:hypothetical protein RF11_03925 [Thelohanellus kitauei]|uniref:Uncharacterized protein n=1 Tax=Thelohanellus kitauei TaxID=669202 RepID=A0A0C2N504_THEKT|nr:hypothetical protein RF11_03925 [Thelohanellus kitauei]